MCVIVYYKGRRCSSVGELAVVVGRENIVFDDPHPAAGDFCLCGVRMAETAWNFNCLAYTDTADVEFVPFGEKSKWADRLMERADKS